MWKLSQKKIVSALFVSTMLFSSIASAHEYYRNNAEWVTPMIVGGVIGYVIKSQQQRPLIINQPPKVISPPGAAPLYQYQWVFDPNCNCQYQVLMQIN
jgi:hypothetical protein